MTIAQLEKRVATLESSLAKLQIQVAAAHPDEVDAAATSAATEKLVPGTEYSLVLSVPVRPVVRLRGRIRSVHRAPQELGFSNAEWTGLQGEENHG